MLLLGFILAFIVLLVAVTATRLALIVLGFFAFWDRKSCVKPNEKGVRGFRYDYTSGSLLDKYNKWQHRRKYEIVRYRNTKHWWERI